MIHKKRSSSSRGSVIIVAMVIVAIGALGIAAGMTVIGARSNLVEAEFEGVERRVKFYNGHSLANRVIYGSYLHDNNAEDTEKTYTLQGNWGEAKIAVLDEAPLIWDDAVRLHPTGAVPLRAFSKDIQVNIGGEANKFASMFHLRSYNPVLGGDLLTIHPTTQTTIESMQVIGNVHVKGRSVFWEANYSDNQLGVKSESFVAPLTNGPDLSFENPSDTAVKPSNFPKIVKTSGYAPSGNHYQGELDIVNNLNSDANSYFHRIERFGGYEHIRGHEGKCDGLGPPTILPSLDDTILLAAISDGSILESVLVGLLASLSPLSSDVIIALLERTVPISAAYLVPLLNAQAPLPDDVMIKLSDHHSGIPESVRLELLQSTSFSHVCDGKGGTIINLQSAFLPNMKIENICHLHFIGQKDNITADISKELAPRIFALKNSDNIHLSKITLEGITNKRRMVLAISQTGVLDGADLMNGHGEPTPAADHHTEVSFESSTPFVEWKSIIETEGTSTRWNLSEVSSATLIGGLRTDHSIRVEGGDVLYIEKETDVESLESLLSRDAWIETYRQ